MSNAASGRPGWLGDLIVLGMEAVLAFDRSGAIVYLNDEACRELSISRDEALGSNVVDYVHADDLSRVAANIDGLSAGARPRPGLMKIRHGSGAWRPYELKVTSITPDGPDEGPLTAVVLRDTSLGDAHWGFLTALAAGEPFLECLQVLALGLSNDVDGPLAIAYDDHDGRRRAAGTVPPLLAGITDRGAADETAGTPWAVARAAGGPAWIATAELPEPFRSEAVRLGAGAGVAMPVDDGDRVDPAMLVQWPPTAAMGPILAESLRRRPHEAVAVALDRRDVNHRLERLAMSDALTNLANRTRFFEVLEELAASGRPYGVCYVDLDRFKPVNDRHGHQIGDEVLRACARRLEHALRPGDLLARLGGDEFAVACADVDVEGIEAIAQRLVAALDWPLETSVGLIDLGGSVGCAGAVAGTDPDHAVAAADAALYDAKRAGRDTWRRLPVEAEV